MQSGRRRFLERVGGIVAGGSLVGLSGCNSLRGFMGGGSANRLRYGSSIRGELRQSDPEGYRGYYDAYAFQGSAGDIVTISMRSPEGDTYLMLQNPSGTRVTRNDDAGVSLNSEITHYTLQSSGQYTIIATSYRDTAVFPYSLSLEKVGEAGESGGNGGGGGSTTPISYGQTVQGSITETDPYSETNRGYHDVYEFQGSAGDGVTISMRSDSGDTYLMLLDPGGTMVTYDDDGASTVLDSLIDGYQLGSSGRYRIIATSFSNSDTFQYRLSLSNPF